MNIKLTIEELELIQKALYVIAEMDDENEKIGELQDYIDYQLNTNTEEE